MNIYKTTKDYIIGSFSMKSQKRLEICVNVRSAIFVKFLRYEARSFRSQV